MRAGVSRRGVAVPISSPRYTWRASAEITVIGVSAASAAATAVLPTPVGPTTTGVRGRDWGLGAAKTAFQLFLWELNHGRSPVDVVRRQRRGQQPHDQLAHLAHVERLSGFDRGATRVGRREAFQAILPAAKPATGEVRDQLLEAARGFEPWVRIRRRMHDNAAAGERLDLVASAGNDLPIGVGLVQVGWVNTKRVCQ